MDVHTIKIVSICSGVGWLDEGLQIGLEHIGRRSRVVGYCERDSYAASVLLARMEDASLEHAPICDSLEDFDERFRGHVDCIVAGFPCQPWSAAGKQQGTDDERWLWPEIADCIERVQPGMVFLENVPGLVSGRGLNHVLDSLAKLRFDAEWASLTAEAVGASHKRERVFILAYREESRSWLLPKPNGRDDTADLGGGIDELADSTERRERIGQRKHTTIEAGSESRTEGHGEELAVTASGGQRELRQSPERNGQPDGGDGPMGQSGGRERRIDKPGRGSNRRTAVGRSGGDLEHASSKRRKTGNEPVLRRGDKSTGRQANDAIEGRGTVADAERPDAHVAKAGRRRGSRGLTAESIQPMANTDVPGHPQRRRERSDSEQEREAAERSCGIFAPGPGDFDGWNRVIADGEFDFRAPATKPGVRVLADGIALVVDQSRADQLRCAGNGCVPLQAAAAFVELVRRIRGDC